VRTVFYAINELADDLSDDEERERGTMRGKLQRLWQVRGELKWVVESSQSKAKQSDGEWKVVDVVVLFEFEETRATATSTLHFPLLAKLQTKSERY
jgi:hypothetical protein